jgi:hypothetical protein
MPGRGLGVHDEGRRTMEERGSGPCGVPAPGRDPRRERPWLRSRALAAAGTLAAAPYGAAPYGAAPYGAAPRGAAAAVVAESGA